MMIVPWNASWSGEEAYEVRPCRWAGGRRAIWQKHAPGIGRPVFAAPHMVRQRRSIAEFRCTVCGEITPSGDRWWFQLGKVLDGKYVTSESPVHKACGETSQQLCPHLKSGNFKFEPFPMRHLMVLAAFVERKELLEAMGVKIRQEDHVIGALKFAWPADKFTMVTP